MEDYRIDVIYGDTNIKDRTMIDFVNFITNYHVRKAVREYLERVSYFEQIDYKGFCKQVLEFDQGNKGYIENFMPGLNDTGYKILKNTIREFAVARAMNIDIKRIVNELCKG